MVRTDVAGLRATIVGIALGGLACSLSAHAATELAPCVAQAAAYHSVNPYVVQAILQHESRLDPRTVKRNHNGSLDVGLGGTNSIHWADLARHGISPSQLLDSCTSTYVTAWMLKKQTARYGNTWYGIAAYHSTTPKYNYRYQVMLWNELVRMGVVAGRTFSVPKP